MKDKFLFLADFHVKARTWTNNTQIRGDSYAAMQKIGDYAETNQLDTLVIGGDFFDSNRPTPEDLVQTVDFLSRFKQVYYIRGNHDSCDPSYLESVSRILGTKNFVALLNSQLIHLGYGSYLTGISWMPSKEEYKKTVQDLLQYFRENHPGKTLYLVLHTSFQHLLSFEGAYTFDQREVNKWCSGIKVVLLVGDVHVRDTTESSSYTNKLEELGHTTFHSPGSVYPLQFNDADNAKYVTVIDLSPSIRDNRERISGVPVEVRKYASFHYANDPEELQRWLESLRKERQEIKRLLPTYARIIVDTGSETPRLSMSDYPDLVIQIQLEADEFDAGHAVDAADGAYTLEQAINDEFPDPDVAEIANRLVASADPADDLRKYLELWQVERVMK